MQHRLLELGENWPQRRQRSMLKGMFLIRHWGRSTDPHELLSFRAPYFSSGQLKLRRSKTRRFKVRLQYSAVTHSDDSVGHFSSQRGWNKILKLIQNTCSFLASVSISNIQTVTAVCGERCGKALSMWCRRQRQGLSHGVLLHRTGPSPGQVTESRASCPELMLHIRFLRSSRPDWLNWPDCFQLRGPWRHRDGRGHDGWFGDTMMGAMPPSAEAQDRPHASDTPKTSP